MFCGTIKILNNINDSYINTFSKFVATQIISSITTTDLSMNI